MDELVGVIETLQRRIRDHAATLRENETRTRVVLIDPLLTTLGWDVSDPTLVTPEYNVGGKRADYALLGDNALTVFLEAKKLDEPLANHRSQIVAYASELGIKFPALTNGNDWEVYDNSKLVPIDQRRILNLSISNTPSHECALQLLLLWRPNLASGQPLSANEPLIGWQPDPPVTTPQIGVSSTPGLVETPRSHVDATQPAQAGWVSLAAYDPVAKTPAPRNIRFPDGTSKPVQKWTNLLIAAGEWLGTTGALTTATKPILSGPKEKVLDFDPSGFTASAPIAGTGLHLNTHGSASNLRRKTRALLQFCDVDPATVQLQVG